MAERAADGLDCRHVDCRNPEGQPCRKHALAELARLGERRCNRGHENVLPLRLWDCPSCTEEMREALRGVRERIDRWCGRADMVIEDPVLLEEIGSVIEQITRALGPKGPASGGLQLVDMQTRSDCLLACLATLTGLPTQQMPQPPASYEELTQGGTPTREQYEAEVKYGNAIRAWLWEKGWLLLRAFKNAPAGYSIASGPSPRNPEIWHCVLHLDGLLFHDPHPSRAAIPAVESYEVLVPGSMRPKAEES